MTRKIALTPDEDRGLSALFDMASNKIEELRAQVEALTAENEDLRNALAKSNQGES